MAKRSTSKFCFCYYVVLLLILNSISIRAQISFTNPNMEGPTGTGVAPPGWTVCASTPDVQPGQWCCTVPAQNGATYVGFCTGEYIGQLLTAPLIANQPYSFEIWLAHSSNYGTAYAAGVCTTPRTNNGQMKIYISNAACGQTQLIWTSPLIGGNGVWTKYTVNFTPTAAYNGIAFYNDEPSSNILMDNMTPVIKAVPLNLLSFNGFGNRGKANISWSTAQEKNNSKFILERSEDGNTFSPIAEIKGAGSSTTRKDYSFTDFIQSTVNTYYYKLKQVDFDARMNELGTLSVNFNTPKNLSVSKIATNSFNCSELNLLVSSANSSPVTVSMMDLFGKKVFTYYLNQDELNHEVSMSIPILPKGIYILNVSDGTDEGHTIKIGL